MCWQSPRNTPITSTPLTLGAGDRVTLDSAVRRAPSSCQDPEATVGFEARYMPRFAGYRHPRAVHGSRGGGTGVGSGSGVGAGSGASGSGGGVRVYVGAARAGGEDSGTGGGGPGWAPSRLLMVDLWLVRNAPDRPDAVVHQKLLVTHEGAAFAFAPSRIETPHGALVVQITGSFSVVKDAAGAEQLVFLTGRRVTFSGSSQPRDTFPDTQGVSRTLNPMPGPDDVLSFELPPLKPARGRPGAPDRFEVRVRITPAP